MEKTDLGITFVAPVILALLLAGCAGNTRPEPDPVRKVLFQCENGESALVRFYTGEERADLLYDGQVIGLQQQRTASGFHYTNAGNGIRGKGDELLLEIGRRAPIRCQVKINHDPVTGG